jgi:phosphatidylglycerophosphate synthase
MEFLVTPAKGEIRRLLGLGLEERGTKMLAAAGLQPAGAPVGEGPLVLYPGERVGPGALGKEIAAIVPTDGEVVAVSGGPAGPDGRPVLVVGGDLRRALLAGAGSTEDAYQRAAAVAGAPRSLNALTDSVTDRASKARAKTMLLRALRKPIDGLVSRTLNRPVSIAISSLVVETPLTPNQMSVICFVLALGAAGLMVGQQFVWGALLMHVSSVLDGCDGEVARLKYQSSKLGGWLDTIFDDISNNTFALCTGIGLYLQYDNRIGTALLVMAATGFAVTVPIVATTYRRLLAAGTSDSGQLDWSGGAEAEGWRRFITSYLAPLVKRDAYLFVFLILAIVQVPWLIAVLYSIGALVAAYTMLSGSARNAA